MFSTKWHVSNSWLLVLVIWSENQYVSKDCGFIWVNFILKMMCNLVFLVLMCINIRGLLSEYIFIGGEWNANFWQCNALLFCSCIGGNVLLFCVLIDAILLRLFPVHFFHCYTIHAVQAAISFVTVVQSFCNVHTLYIQSENLFLPLYFCRCMLSCVYCISIVLLLPSILLHVIMNHAIEIVRGIKPSVQYALCSKAMMNTKIFFDSRTAYIHFYCT